MFFSVIHCYFHITHSNSFECIFDSKSEYSFIILPTFSFNTSNYCFRMSFSECRYSGFCFDCNNLFSSVSLRIVLSILSIIYSYILHCFDNIYNFTFSYLESPISGVYLFIVPLKSPDCRSFDWSLDITLYFSFEL